jgi:hypothetical protein
MASSSNTPSAELSQQSSMSSLLTQMIWISFLVPQALVQTSHCCPLYKYLSDFGYEVQGETIDIEGWPVQFLPVFNPLVEEALKQAKETQFERTTTRVMTSEHLVAIMLQTGRLKDYARMQQFLEHKVVDRRRLTSILKRHTLDKKWNAFQRDYL